MMNAAPLTANLPVKRGRKREKIVGYTKNVLVPAFYIGLARPIEEDVG